MGNEWIGPFKCHSFHIIAYRRAYSLLALYSNEISSGDRRGQYQSKFILMDQFLNI